MTSKCILILAILLINIPTFAQEIKGTVQNSQKDALEEASVTLQDTTGEIKNYAITDSKGFYRIKNVRFRGLGILEVRHLGYEVIRDSIFLKDNDEVIVKSFALNDTSIKFQEIEITTDVSWEIYEKGDTTLYNAEDFSDGSEKVVEDVLKKIPGVEVNKSGTISYKGEIVEKVLYEGGDLFGRFYSVSTQNIRADVIDKIQAIENYSDNEMLKGIREGDKTVLNIELKDEFLFTPSGNSLLKYGYSDYYDANLNLITMGKTIKNFTMAKTNSIGRPSSSGVYYFDSANQFLSKNENYDIPESPANISYVTPDINDRRVNDNHSYSGSFNNLITFSENLKFRTNYFLELGTNSLERVSERLFVLQDNSFEINELQNYTQKPRKHEGELYFDFNISESLKLIINNSLNYDNSLGRSTQITSSGDFKEELKNDEFLLNPNIALTHRFTENSALILNSSFLTNKTTQNYEINFESSDISHASQRIHSENELFDISSEFIYKHRSNRFSFTGGYSNNDWSLGSKFVQSDSLYLSLKSNQEVEEKGELQKLNFGATHKFKLNNWNFTYGFDFINKVINSNNGAEKNQGTYISPQLSTTYKISDKGALLVSYSYGKTFPQYWSIFSDKLLTNYRTIDGGLTALPLISAHNLFSLITYSDLFNNLFTANLSFTYTKKDISVGYKSFVQPNITEYKSILTPGNNNYNLNASIEKYSTILSGTFIVNSGVSWFKYYNLINNSDLRQNLSFSSDYSFILRTDWNQSFNIETGINYQYYFYKSKRGNTKTTKINPFANIVLEPTDDLNISLNSQFSRYLQGGMDRREEIYFIDVDFRYKILDNKLEFIFNGRNLLNYKTYQYRTTSDYYILQESHKLLPRHFLFGIDFRF